MLNKFRRNHIGPEHSDLDLAENAIGTSKEILAMAKTISKKLNFAADRATVANDALIAIVRGAIDSEGPNCVYCGQTVLGHKVGCPGKIAFDAIKRLNEMYDEEQRECRTES